MLIVCILCMAGSIPAQAAGTSQPTSAKAQGGKWVSTSSGKKYRYKNGTYAKYTWLKIKGKYYFFLKSGNMAANRMLTLSGKTYYLTRSGARVNNTWMVKSGKTYYFDKNGVRAQNKWLKRNGQYYYVGANGAVLKNQWVDHNRYYVGAKGTRLKSCVKDGYYLNASGKKVVKVFKGEYIFVGDSRMVGMQQAAASSDTLYIAKVGQGYSWLKSTGGVKLRYYLQANPKVKVILALGVNDLGNSASYISYYKKLIKDFPKTQFSILSVNPVDEAKAKKNGYTVKNRSIEAFNRKMYLAFRTRYVNTYKDLKKDGFQTRDGIHYTNETYQELNQLIRKKVP